MTPLADTRKPRRSLMATDTLPSRVLIQPRS
jgi:hypothetical protein